VLFLLDEDVSDPEAEEDEDNVDDETLLLDDEE
jgi:hypothetical protein